MKKERLRQIYAEHHSKGQRYGFIFGGEERALLLKEWIGVNKRVLDLGCRDGTLTRFYVPGNEVVGIDIDQEALDRCKAELGIESHWTDISDGLPFEGFEFDAVVAAEVLEHVPCPSYVVQEIDRVLKPGGIFVGSVPNAFRLKNRFLFLLGRDFETDLTHLHHFSPGSLCAMLGKHFVDVEIRYAASRFLMLWPRMFGNCMLWKCHKGVPQP